MRSTSKSISRIRFETTIEFLSFETLFEIIGMDQDKKRKRVTFMYFFLDRGGERDLCPEELYPEKVLYK